MGAWRSGAFVAVARSAIAASVLLLFPASVGAEVWRVNDVDRSVSIHLRLKPSNKSKVLAYIPVATTGLKGGPCEDDWCPVEFRGFNGYVFSKYLVRDEETAKAAPETVASIPTASAEASGQEAPKVLGIIANGGTRVAVYAFPNEKLPIAGYLPEGTKSVERVGPCIHGWCNIRSATLTGWLQDSVIVKSDLTEGDSQPAARGAPVSVPDGKESRALNSTETTATQADADVPATAATASADGNKLYSLAGLSSSALAMRGEAEDAAPVVAFIPAEAKDIEGLHKCTGKWCFVRRGNASGWVERRHLADESVESSQHFQADGWKALDVLDQPGANAGVVGRIPAFATGIVPIGGCDKMWCHVRYLGVAGWVSASSLAPLTR